MLWIFLFFCTFTVIHKVFLASQELERYHCYKMCVFIFFFKGKNENIKQLQIIIYNKSTNNLHYMAQSVAINYNLMHWNAFHLTIV